MSKDTVTIPLEEFECLRRRLEKVEKILLNLGIGSFKAPKLTPSEKRQLKYKRLLDTGQKITKKEFLNKD